MLVKLYHSRYNLENLKTNIGYNWACVRDIADVLASNRGFWGSGNWMVSIKFHYDNPGCYGNEIRRLWRQHKVKDVTLLHFRLLISITMQNNKKAQLSLTNPRDAKACQNCSNSTCLQRCRWQSWPIFMRLTAIASEIREIPRNSLKIQTYGVIQGHRYWCQSKAHMWLPISH